jgi:hypothetical protein
MPMPLKSMSSIRKPTDGLGAFVLFALADTADLEIAGTRTPRGPVEIGHQWQDIFEMLLAGIMQCLRGQHACTDRGIFQGQRAESGGHDHFFERLIFRMCAGEIQYGQTRQNETIHLRSS